MKERFVVVTTDSTRRGVFCGELVSHEADVAVLREARMAVYWSADVRGVVGLAATGPTSGCRISPPADLLKINGVTAVIDCTEDAVEAWRKQPWA